ncbi:MAG: RNA 2',3'-cyclic phosphodiesterase [Proteobacteria bacterium]|nr:RNA 2',3'-cyclic phosphodiesterase [Pseudomonadota bacterium]MBU0966746.1 RNA 2',3'-cyclic phosphodiesterase [Pseudomonadota bacterium]
MIRLFVAVDLPENIKDELGRICFGLPGAKWVPPDQLHLTLRFIGEVDGGLFREIREDLENVEAKGFPMRLQGLGYFPPRKEPRVLWVGMEKSELLLQLRKRVDRQLTQLGIPAEKRNFSPHITIARLRETPLVRLTNFLSGNALFSLPEFQVDSFYLYSSVLTPKGAIHQQEGAYSLAET